MQHRDVTSSCPSLSAALGTDALGRDVDIMIGTGQRDGVPRFMHFFQSVVLFGFIVI